MANDSMYSRSSSFRWIFRNGAAETEKSVIGFLAFEISALMSRLVQLWHLLEDAEFTRVKVELAGSNGLKKLVSEDEQYLMKLFLKDVVEDLQYVARSIAVFGRRCSDPVLHHFERFVKDPVKNDFEWFGWQYRWKKMERRVKKMQRFVAFTTELSRELEVLADVERTRRRMQANFAFSRGKFHKYKQKVSGHRRRVHSLKEMTPWNRSFDYILRLFMRSIITITVRIKIVFDVNEMPSFEGSNRVDSEPRGRDQWPELSGERQRNHSHLSNKLADQRKKTRHFSHIRSFKDCKEGGIGSPVLHGCRPIRSASMNLNGILAKDMDKNKVEIRASSSGHINGGRYSIASFFSKEILSSFSPPSTLGPAALDIHYANMIMLIEKFASAPQLIGLDERDDLYNMLPATMRRTLRSRMKSAAKIQHSSVYDPVLAAEWKSAMMRILQWLSPLAHNMETWYSERSFEKQHAVVSRSQALLVQTLHYANKEKTEDAVMELLVALNNIYTASGVGKKRFSDDPDGVQARRSYSDRNDKFCFDGL